MASATRGLWRGACSTTTRAWRAIPPARPIMIIAVLHVSCEIRCGLECGFVRGRRALLISAVWASSHKRHQDRPYAYQPKGIPVAVMYARIVCLLLDWVRMATARP